MFIDASALCAILAREPDAAQLLTRLLAVRQRLTSPTAVWETVVALARIRKVEPTTAHEMVDEFLAKFDIEIISIPPEAAALAVEAYARFGRGRHPAGLNFGDCFAYACARHHAVPLLYKGADFAATDIERA